MNRRKTSLPTKAKAKAKAASINSYSKLKKHVQVKYLVPYLSLGYIIALAVTFTFGVYLIKADHHTGGIDVTVTGGFDKNDDSLEIVSNSVPIEGVVFYKNPKTKVYGCGYPGWRKFFKGVFPELADKIENGTMISTENGVLSTEDDVLFMGTSGSCFQTKGYYAVHDDERYELSMEWISEHFKGHVVILNGEVLIEGQKWRDINDLSTIPKRMYMLGTPGNGCQSRQLTLAAQFIQSAGVSEIFQGLQPKPTSTKERFLIYINTHCVRYRQQAFSDIARRFPNLTLEYGGKCKGIKGGPNNIAKRPIEGKNIDANFHIMTEYRFCFVMENEKHEGYISEKIMNAFAAGCIP